MFYQNFYIWDAMTPSLFLDQGSVSCLYFALNKIYGIHLTKKVIYIINIYLFVIIVIIIILLYNILIIQLSICWYMHWQFTKWPYITFYLGRYTVYNLFVFTTSFTLLLCKVFVNLILCHFKDIWLKDKTFYSSFLLSLQNHSCK